MIAVNLTLANDTIDLLGWTGSILVAAFAAGVAIWAAFQTKKARKAAERANEIAAGQNQLIQQANDTARDAVRIAEQALAHQKENVELVLEVTPYIQQESIIPSDDLGRTFLMATIKHQEGPTARIRDVYVETDHGPIRPAWTLIDGRTDGVAEIKPYAFDLKAGQKAEVFFCERIKGEPGQGKLKAPDYYPMPWGGLSTANRIMVKCANSKTDHPSTDNDAVRRMKDWVLRHRNQRTPVGEVLIIRDIELH